MGTIPSRKLEQLAFFEAHWPMWNVTPGDVGLTAAQVTLFKTLTQSARTSYDAAEAARVAARSATLVQDADLAAAYSQCSDLIRIIRGFAQTQSNPAAVYSAAGIPGPAIPQPAPPPGTCTDYTATILDGGALRINWKCVNPAGTGTVYEVRRKIGSGEYVFIGAVGTKKFTDETLPAGSSNVTYQVVGTRGTLRGVASSFNVTFGVGGGGGFTLTAGENVKLAA